MTDRKQNKQDCARRYTEQQMELLLSVQDMVRNEVRRQINDINPLKPRKNESE